MSNSKSSTPISLSFLNLPDADQATFERVLNFFAARGNSFQVSEDTDADLIITTDDYSNVEQALNSGQNSLLLVVTDEKNCPYGDMQLQKPLLVTRVMRAMEQAAELHANREAPDTPQSVSPKPSPKAPAKPQYNALVIDDNAAIRKQLEIELRTSGIPSEAAESGEQALEMISHANYDLIFLDRMLTGIDG